MEGVILSSASHGAKQEDVEKVLAGAGLEVEKEETAATTTEVVEEPKRDDFDSEEEFEAAHVDWQDAQPKAKEDEEDDEEDEEPKPAKKSKFARRIEKIVGPVRRENEELKRRLEALEKGEKKEEKKAAAEVNPRPKRADFESDEKYEDALVKWGVTKALAEDNAKDAEKKQQQQLEANLSNYRAQVEEFKDTVDDWDEVVNQDIPMHTGVQLAVMEQENGAAVIYYLGRHPEYARKLAEMSPLSAVMEVGRLSARLLKTGSSSERGGGDSKTKVKAKQRAPEPIRPVSTSATSSTLTSADAAKKKDYKAFKAAQRAGR